jgi:drug/metabolite transporter (DMT)-like permease
MSPTNRQENRPVRGIALKLTAVLLFTIMSALVKFGREVVPAGEAVFYRSLFAIPPILIWAAWHRRLADAVRVTSRRAHLIRGLVGVMAMSCGFAALGLLPLPEVIAINFAAPVIATALAALLLRERVGMIRWTAVAVGLAGVLLMLWPRLSLLAGGGPRDAQALGAVLALVGAALAALAAVQIRQMTRTETTLSIVFWFGVTCTVASLVTLPFGWAFPTGTTLVALIAAGLLGGTAQLLMTEAYRQADASTIAPMSYSSMIYGLGIGYFVFAEVPGFWVLIGASILIAAGILITWREHRLGIESARARALKSPEG